VGHGHLVQHAALVGQVHARPVGQPGVDRPAEREHALRHAAGRGDDDDHQHLRLEREHLDVTDRGRADPRRRHQRLSATTAIEQLV